MAKELIAGMAAAECDKLFETKGEENHLPLVVSIILILP